MTLETYKRVVDTFKDAANISIVGNGEPLLNRHFLDMVSYSKHVRRARVTTLTNGCFRQSQIDHLLTSGLDLISISLKGYDPRDYARMTKLSGHVFDTVVNNTRRLVERRTRVPSHLTIAASFILDKHNYKHIGAMLDLADSLGVDQVKFDPFIPPPMTRSGLGERCITTSNHDAVQFLSRYAVTTHRCEVRRPVVLNPDMRHATCSSFFKVLRVGTEGHVSGCVVNRLGMESTEMFSERDVWNSTYFQSMRSRFMQEDHAALPSICKRCHQYCGVSVESLG